MFEQALLQRLLDDGDTAVGRVGDQNQGFGIARRQSRQLGKVAALVGLMRLSVGNGPAEILEGSTKCVGETRAVVSIDIGQRHRSEALFIGQFAQHPTLIGVARNRAKDEVVVFKRGYQRRRRCWRNQQHTGGYGDVMGGRHQGDTRQSPDDGRDVVDLDELGCALDRAMGGARRAGDDDPEFPAFKDSAIGVDLVDRQIDGVEERRHQTCDGS